MREITKISEALFEKIRSRFEDISLGDENAKSTQKPEDARFFNFDFETDNMKHGNITISIADGVSLKVYYSKNISDQLDDHAKAHWESFLRELRMFAKRNILSFEPRDITRSIKQRDLEQQSKADDTYDKDDIVKVAESRLHGTTRSSYQECGPVKIIVRHSDRVDPEQRGARARHIRAIYLETADGERFKLPENNLRLARAQAQHLRQGGQLNDDFGQHITAIAEEIKKLRPFKNSMRRRTFEDAETQQMVEAAFEYHGLLSNTLKRMSGRTGYQKCKEAYVADDTLMDDFDVDALRERFVKRTYNDKMDDALPVVQKAYKMKKENKLSKQFEMWAEDVAESWDHDEEDAQQWGAEPVNIDDLIDAFENEVALGVDAINATAVFGDIIQNDKLADALVAAAQENPDADARGVVSSWLQDNEPHVYQELMNEMGDLDYPAEPAEPNEEDMAEGNTYGATGTDEPNTDPNVQVKEGKAIEEARETDMFWAIVSNLFDKKGYKTFNDLTPKDHSTIAREFGHNFNAQDVQDVLSSPAAPKQFRAVRQHNDKLIDLKSVMSEENKINEGEWQEDDVEMIQSAIIRRILNNIGEHSKLLKKAGPDGVMNAARDVASFHAPVEELGTSDISIMVREVYREVGVEYPEHKEHRSEFEEAYKKKLEYCDACDRTIDKCVCENLDAKVPGDSTASPLTYEDETGKLESLIGQTFYVKSEGNMGTVSGVAPNHRNSVVVDLDNGTTTVVHFTDLQAEQPGIAKRTLDKLKSITGGGDLPPRKAEPIGSVSTDVKDIKRLAGL